MEEPPIEMTEEEFESLKTHARTEEIGCLGQAGKHGGVTRRNLWDGLALVLRCGRYYLVAVDEFGLMDRILWSEKR